jgi:hypothetical protein
MHGSSRRTGTAHAGDKRELTVMSRNLYLGASLNGAIEAVDATEFLVAVATIYGTVQFTDFPTRAQEIAADRGEPARPVGLQGGRTDLAAHAPLSLDFQDPSARLPTRASAWSRVIAEREHRPDSAADQTVPSASCADLPGSRFQPVNDDDAPSAGNPERGAAQQVLLTPVGPPARSRCLIDGDPYSSFMNTHLETEDFPGGKAQARSFAGPRKRGAVRNVTSTRADGSTTATYEILTKSWFRDAWDANPDDPGFTCCENETLTNPASEASSRIDLVLTHAAVRALDATIVGNEPFEASPPLWASDHAGVVATLRLH